MADTWAVRPWLCVPPKEGTLSADHTSLAGAWALTQHILGSESARLCHQEEHTR